MRELSFLNKGITINLTDKRRKDDNGDFFHDKFFSNDGLKEFIRFLDSNREPIVQNVISMEGEKNGIPVEVAMIYNLSLIHI